ncbi:MAG: Rrf2 family transcriptional regulator [Candidatus Margulisiibacteriota bacterium]
MKLTIKTIYGIQALFELAKHSGEELKSAQIAEAQNIPARYLEQILNTLKKNKLVKSLRGNKGGYVLSKAAKEISLLNVIEAVEGQITFAAQTSGDSAIKSVLKEIEKGLADKLGKITLESLLNEKNKQDSVFNFSI